MRKESKGDKKRNVPMEKKTTLMKFEASGLNISRENA